MLGKSRFGRIPLPAKQILVVRNSQEFAAQEFAAQEFASQEFSRQEFGRARPGPGFRYTEIADSWRLDLSTHRLPIHWSLRGLNPWPWAHKTHALTN